MVVSQLFSFVFVPRWPEPLLLLLLTCLAGDGFAHASSYDPLSICSNEGGDSGAQASHKIHLSSDTKRFVVVLEGLVSVFSTQALPVFVSSCFMLTCDSSAAPLLAPPVTRVHRVRHNVMTHRNGDAPVAHVGIVKIQIIPNRGSDAPTSPAPPVDPASPVRSASRYDTCVEAVFH